ALWSVVCMSHHRERRRAPPSSVRVASPAIARAVKIGPEGGLHRDQTRRESPCSMIWCLAWSSSDSCLCFFAEPFVYRRELEGVACRPNDVRQLALDEPAQVLGSSAKRCRRC